VHDGAPIFLRDLGPVRGIDGPFRALDFLRRVVEQLQGTIVSDLNIDSLR
jgi:hypothetical protein